MTSLRENFSNHMRDTGFEAIRQKKDISPNLTNNESFSYFKLPPEIRNRIMHLILGPGLLYIRSRPTIDNDWEYNRADYLTIKKSKGSSCIITSTFRKQNINLLLTCHQAFREGYGIYQSLHAQATFICPTGPLEDTQAVIKSLKPAETTSVRFASMHMSIADVGTHVYQELVQQVDHPIDIKNEELTDNALLMLTNIMRCHWHGKLLLIRESFPALEVLHLVKDELNTYKQLALFLEGAAGTTRPLLADPGSESWDDVECRLIAYGDWGSQNRFDGGPLSEYLEFHEKTEVDATLRENARGILEELSAQLPKLRKI